MDGSSERPVTVERLYRAACRSGSGSSMCRRVCEVVTACAPAVPLARLATVVRYAVWAVRLDDRLDAPAPDPAALDALRAQVVMAASPDAPVPAEPIPRELREYRVRLGRYDRTGAVAARFSAAVVDAVETAIAHAGLAQAVRAGTAPLPTVEEYLAVAARTSNYHSFAYAILAVAGGAPDGGQLAAVDRALGHGARAVRLANDLRSVDRDRTEQTLNVLELRTAAGNRMTRPAVEAAIDEQVARHDSTLPAGAAVAGVLTCLLRQSVGLYRRTDLR